MNYDLAEQIAAANKDRKPKVAIQGVTGSFHQIAAHQALGDGIEIVPCTNFRRVAQAVENGEADMGVMAIENSIAGSILPNYNILQRNSLKIVGEWYLHIKQNLMANKGVKLEDIKEVHSHPMALYQCADFLDGHNWKLVETDDTALSARHVAESGSREHAAIAGELAAELFGLEIIAPEINTIRNNLTRFLIIARKDSRVVAHNANKASLYIKIDHRNGSLSKALKALDNSDINMTKLQSYPIPSEPWHYMFHIDMEFGNVEVFIQTLDMMREDTEELHVYGVYQKGMNENI